MARVSEKTESSDRTRVNIIKYPQSGKTSKSKPQPDPEIGKKETANQSSVQKTQYVPDTNLTLACLVCLCFNMPLGAIAMYLSLTAARAYRDGDEKAGERRAKWSVFLSLFSIVTTVLIVMSAVLWLAIDKQAQRELRYPTKT